MNTHWVKLTSHDVKLTPHEKKCIPHWVKLGHNEIDGRKSYLCSHFITIATCSYIC